MQTVNLPQNRNPLTPWWMMLVKMGRPVFTTNRPRYVTHFEKLLLETVCTGISIVIFFISIFCRRTQSQLLFKFSRCLCSYTSIVVILRFITCRRSLLLLVLLHQNLPSLSLNHVEAVAIVLLLITRLVLASIANPLKWCLKSHSPTHPHYLHMRSKLVGTKLELLQPCGRTASLTSSSPCL